MHSSTAAGMIRVQTVQPLKQGDCGGGAISSLLLPAALHAKLRAAPWGLPLWSCLSFGLGCIGKAFLLDQPYPALGIGIQVWTLRSQS
jgi:hypothetical protein